MSTSNEGFHSWELENCRLFVASGVWSILLHVALLLVALSDQLIMQISKYARRKFSCLQCSERCAAEFSQFYRSTNRQAGRVKFLALQLIAVRWFTLSPFHPQEPASHSVWRVQVTFDPLSRLISETGLNNIGGKRKQMRSCRCCCGENEPGRAHDKSDCNILQK